MGCRMPLPIVQARISPLGRRQAAFAEPRVRKSAGKPLRMTDGVGCRARMEFHGVPAPALALSDALNSFLKPGPEPIRSLLEARSVLH
jgi:hypothetical protein